MFITTKIITSSKEREGGGQRVDRNYDKDGWPLSHMTKRPISYSKKKSI